MVFLAKPRRHSPVCSNVPSFQNSCFLKACWLHGLDEGRKETLRSLPSPLDLRDCWPVTGEVLKQQQNREYILHYFQESLNLMYYLCFSSMSGEYLFRNYRLSFVVVVTY